MKLPTKDFPAESTSNNCCALVPNIAILGWNFWPTVLSKQAIIERCLESSTIHIPGWC